MKLRNKKTGFIGSIISGVNTNDYQITTDDYTLLGTYNSLAEINEEWEDYVPSDPLIEDKEIREIIRAWAKINGITELMYDYDENSLEDIFRNTITFNPRLGLEDGHYYTITELCGEKEE